MDNGNGIIYPESEAEAEVQLPSTLGKEKHWVFKETYNGNEYTAFGELLIYTNCLAVVRDGEFIAVFPAAIFVALEKPSE